MRAYVEVPKISGLGQSRVRENGQRNCSKLRRCKQLQGQPIVIELTGVDCHDVIRSVPSNVSGRIGVNIRFSRSRLQTDVSTSDNELRHQKQHAISGEISCNCVDDYFTREHVFDVTSNSKLRIEGDDQVRCEVIDVPTNECDWI